MVGIYLNDFYPCLGCGHDQEAHDVRRGYNNKALCLKCVSLIKDKSFPPTDKYHAFKLDNLSYIEGLARNKGLI